VNKVSTHVHLDPELVQWLKDEAKRQHCSMAQVIRTAVVELKRQREAADQGRAS